MSPGCGKIYVDSRWRWLGFFEVQREDREVQGEYLGGATGGKLGLVSGIPVISLLINHRV
jgi:hypothetical protein